MTSKSKFDILEFLERWSKLAGLLAGIASAIAFAANSIWLSVAMILVGSTLFGSWLVLIITRRPSYPIGARIAAGCGLVLLTCSLGIGSCIGINALVATVLPPSNATPLPATQLTALSLVIEPGPYWDWVGLVTKQVDRSILKQDIDPRSISFPNPVPSDSPRFPRLTRFTRPNQISTVHVILTGKSVDDPVQISNRVPIRMLSYQPISDEVDLVGMPTGGGQDVWLLTANLSERTLSYPDQMTWAVYDPDLGSRIKESMDPTRALQSLPTELQKVVLSGTKIPPDYFLLTKNETIVFSVATIFSQSGIYRLQFGAEYLYKGSKAIAWAEPAIDVYVPKDYYLWAEGERTYYLMVACKLRSTGKYDCLNRCVPTANGWECK